MKKLLISMLLSLAVICSSAQVGSRSLEIGDDAPTLEVFKWLKGNPVDQLEKGRVYVLEFWATWCAPCIAAMPHISELARQYRGRADFIGISVWESNGKNIPEVNAIQTFVDQKGDDMDYIVGMDDPTKNLISTSWLRAAGLNGIPATFIVNKEGKIAWIGHPSDLDKVLSEIVGAPDSYDLGQAKEKFEKEQHARAKMQIVQSIMGYGMAKNYGMAFHGAQKQMKEDPNFEKDNFWIVVRSYLSYNSKIADSYIQEKCMDGAFVSSVGYEGEAVEARERLLDDYAKVVAQQSGLDLNLYYDARDRLQKMAKKTPDDYLLWSALAEAHIKLNEPEEAIAAQQNVLKLYLADLKTKENSEFSEFLKNGLKRLEDRLDEFKKLKLLKDK